MDCLDDRHRLQGGDLNPLQCELFIGYEVTGNHMVRYFIGLILIDIKI